MEVESQSVLNIWNKSAKGVNFVQIEISLYNLKTFKTYVSKVSLQFSFGVTRYEIWSKERLRIKLAKIKLTICFPTTKTQEHKGQMTFNGTMEYNIKKISLNVVTL